MVPKGEVSNSITELKSIAFEAGAIILKYFKGKRDVVRYKEDESPLTVADLESHQVVSKRLLASFPHIPILSEEAEVPDYSIRKNWKKFWLVDPLDGTKEFLNGGGDFTVNIALIEDQEPKMGLVYAPVLGLFYYASVEVGSWKEEVGRGPPIRIFSSIPDLARGLVVAESKSHPSEKLEVYLKGLPVRERIQIGSSLKFCLVAEGKADIYPRMNPTMEWDVAAGDCVFRNSGRKGSRVSRLTYNKSNLKNESFVIGLE